MFEYLLLISSFILPVWYRYFFWFWNLEKYKWFNIQRDKDNLFHMFFIIEIFLLIWSFTIFVEPATEIIIFNLLFYYGIISSIFVIWKIVRKKTQKRIESRNKYYLFLMIIFWCIWLEIFWIFHFEQIKVLYSYILSVLLLAPLISYIVIQIFFKKILMKKIVILSGWPWLESEIAKKSAKLFKDHINKDFDYYELPKQLSDFLKNKDKYNLAIPVFHGEYWEDGKVFAFLDILGIPHTFSDYSTHALCLDKEKANTLVFQLWVNVPFQYIAENSESFPENYPVIMKPNQWGSSFHTYKVNNHQEFYDNFNKTRKDLDDKILIQEFITGEEYSVPVVNWEILPIMKLEKANDQVFDYEAKYEENQEIKETFPEIKEELYKKLTTETLKIYNHFNVKWMARVEFIVKDWELNFLEVNTIPGMTEASILPKAWKLSGRNLDELVKEITKI
jgi:D-alanine-D-alanine ligase